MNLTAWRNEQVDEYGGESWPQPFAVSLCPQTYEAVKAIRALPEGGGYLHAQVEDWNLEDEWFTRRWFDRELPMTIVELNCYLLLAAMNEAERHAAVAIAHGYTLNEASEQAPMR